MRCDRWDKACAHPQQGFTLVEMMVVVAIVGVMSAFAVPEFSRMVARNDVKEAARQIAVTIQTARMLAMNTNTAVTIQPQLVLVGNGQTLQVSVQNANGGPLLNPTTNTPLATGSNTSAAHVTSLTAPGGAAITPISINPQGLLAPVGTPGQVWLVTGTQANVVYSVTISPGGRVRWCGMAVAAGGVCP